jgi:hypothetical protein
MDFDPYNYSMKIWESNGSPTPKVGVHLGVWRSNSHTPPYSQPPGSMKCDSRASLLARTFASFCLGHEPKARVPTMIHITIFNAHTRLKIVYNDFKSIKE